VQGAQRVRAFAGRAAARAERRKQDKTRMQEAGIDGNAAQAALQLLQALAGGGASTGGELSAAGALLQALASGVAQAGAPVAGGNMPVRGFRAPPLRGTRC